VVQFTIKRKGWQIVSLFYLANQRQTYDPNRGYLDNVEQRMMAAGITGGDPQRRTRNHRQNKKKRIEFLFSTKFEIPTTRRRNFAMEMFAEVASEGLWLILILSLLPLLASLVVGLLVSLFQALTQIQEQTLTFVPKIIATILVIMITFGWMMEVLQEFAKKTFDLMLQISVAR
jgi:flagellar biosynthetic protein FliQ